MRILVTGSSGFIGNRIVRKLIDSGHSVIGIDIRPTTDMVVERSSLFTFLQLDLSTSAIPDFQSYQIELVLHLAIVMRPGRKESFDELLCGTHRLLSAMAAANVPYLLGMSSLSVLDFGKVQPGSLIDEQTPRCVDFEQMGRYAALKSKQEEVFSNFGRKHQLKRTVIIRPGLVYQDQSISDAYVGIVKSKVALVASHQGLIPMIELDALIAGVSEIISKLNTLTENTIIHFVDDVLPNQLEYIEGLQKLGKLPSRLIRIPWRFLNGLVLISYALLRMANMHAYLPDLLKPQAFATRLKPFNYSNQRAKHLLHWIPTQFKK